MVNIPLWVRVLIVIFVILSIVGTGLYLLITHLFVDKLSKIDFDPGSSVGPGSGSSVGPGPGTKQPIKGDTIIITDDGTKLETYIETPVKRCFSGTDEMCDKIDSKTEMSYVYDIKGGSFDQGNAVTSYDHDTHLCGDGTVDCIYEEKYDDNRKIIGITNKKGEDYIQGIVDDVWSGKLVMDDNTKNFIKKTIHFDRASGKMYLINNSGEKVKVIPGLMVGLHVGNDDLKIPVGIMIMYIIMYYKINDLPKPTIKLDFKSENTLGQIYILISSLLLNLSVMRTQVLLKIQVRNLDILRRLEEVLELLIEDEDTTIVGVLETIVLDVLVHGTSHLTTGGELPIGETQESAKLIRNLLLTIEAVILRTIGTLLTSGILLSRPDLANNLGEGLDVVTDGGDFSEDGFSRHIIHLIR